MNDELTEMEKAMRKYIKSLGSGLVKTKGVFKIGRVTYHWNVRKG